MLFISLCSKEENCFVDGILAQDFRPRIHLTESDFASITANGALCGPDGQLGAVEFENVMRKQVRNISASAPWKPWIKWMTKMIKFALGIRHIPMSKDKSTRCASFVISRIFAVKVLCPNYSNRSDCTHRGRWRTHWPMKSRMSLSMPNS